MPNLEEKGKGPCIVRQVTIDTLEQQHCAHDGESNDLQSYCDIYCLVNITAVMRESFLSSKYDIFDPAGKQDDQQ